MRHMLKSPLHLIFKAPDLIDIKVEPGILKNVISDYRNF